MYLLCVKSRCFFLSFFTTLKFCITWTTVVVVKLFFHFLSLRTSLVRLQRLLGQRTTMQVHFVSKSLVILLEIFSSSCAKRLEDTFVLFFQATPCLVLDSLLAFQTSSVASVLALWAVELPLLMLRMPAYLSRSSLLKFSAVPLDCLEWS